MSSGRLVVVAFLCFGAAAFAAQDVAGVVEGTVSKVDGATRQLSSSPLMAPSKPSAL